MATLVTSVADIPDDGSYLFTVKEPDGGRQEVIVVKLDGSVAAWKNFCQHEPDQRLDRGNGAAIRDEMIICPKHGSSFHTVTGDCHNGPAAGATLEEVDISVRHGQVYLTDDVEFVSEGGTGDDDDPASSSHLRF